MDASGDEYCYRGYIVLDGLRNTVKVVDDILMFENSFPEHVQQVRQFLVCCRMHGIMLNPERFQISQAQVEFCIYFVLRNGIASDPNKLFTRLQISLLQPTSQIFTCFSTRFTSWTIFRQTLPVHRKHYVDCSRKDLFSTGLLITTRHSTSLKTFVSPPIVAHFDPKLPTVLQMDTSRSHGLGFRLLQLHGESHRLVHCGSRHLSDTEFRYAMIELEALAID